MELDDIMNLESISYEQINKLIRFGVSVLFETVTMEEEMEEEIEEKIGEEIEKIGEKIEENIDKNDDSKIIFSPNEIISEDKNFVKEKEKVIEVVTIIFSDENKKKYRIGRTNPIIEKYL